MSERNGYKVYVDVTAEFSSDGILRPLGLIWEDGTRYDIDRDFQICLPFCLPIKESVLENLLSIGV